MERQEIWPGLMCDSAPDEPGRAYTEAVGALLRQLLADELSVRLEVTGGSMSPFIRSHDMVTIHPLKKLRFGEVVAVKLAPFREETRMVVHRVVRRHEAYCVTRGDAVSANDQPVAYEDVVGRVGEVERLGRRIRLGLGPERVLIALLSRSGLLRHLLKALRWLKERVRIWRGGSSEEEA
jgi:signal peptidase I